MRETRRSVHRGARRRRCQWGGRAPRLDQLEDVTLRDASRDAAALHRTELDAVISREAAFEAMAPSSSPAPLLTRVGR